MNITTDEAQASLKLIDQITKQTRRRLTIGGGAYYLILWGAIWFLGNLASQFLSGAQAGKVWIILDMLGILVSFWIGYRRGSRIRSPLGNRIGLMWLAILVYGALILWISSPQSGNQANLLISVVVMLGYVLSGLWLGRLISGVGILITLVALLGYLAFPAYFSLWMAVFGGGVLLGSGLMILRRWS